MKDLLPGQIRSLVAQARTFPRSRRELARMVLENPSDTVPVLVSIANENLHDEGAFIVSILTDALDKGASAELIELIYRLIPKKSVHFVTLAAQLSEAMIELVRSVRPVDRRMESILLHNHAVHLRDCGEIQQAWLITAKAVRLLRRLTKHDRSHRQMLVCDQEATRSWKSIDAHVRRRVRAIAIRQQKRPRFLFRHLIRNGAHKGPAAKTAWSSRGVWHKSARFGIPTLPINGHSPANVAQHDLPNSGFGLLGQVSKNRTGNG